MSTFDDLVTFQNIQPAWRWVRSNPDAAYESYFRDSYTHYAVADESLLRDLQDRLRRGVYDPTHACKIFFPKTFRYFEAVLAANGRGSDCLSVGGECCRGAISS